jgi:hypothetical protein
MTAETQNFTFDILYDHGGVTMTFVEWADGVRNYEVHHWDEAAQEWTFVAEATDPSTFDHKVVGGRPRLVARTHYRKITKP